MAGAETTREWQKKVTRFCFPNDHNKSRLKESGLEQMMTRKIRVNTVEQMRGGLPMAAGGDKNYTTVAYSQNFYQPGGLVVGSTHNFTHKSSGGGKTVDFYSGLQIDKPLNPDAKNYE